MSQLDSKAPRVVIQTLFQNGLHHILVNVPLLRRTAPNPRRNFSRSRVECLFARSLS